jgi:hypothetical protein
VAWPESFLKNGMAYQNKGMFETCKILYIFILLFSIIVFDTALTYIVGHGLNSLFCDCSGHVEIDMTLLHSGMFGKCEIGHGPSIILLIL